MKRGLFKIKGDEVEDVWLLVDVCKRNQLCAVSAGDGKVLFGDNRIDVD